MTEPIIKPAKDGIYPRCVWCGGENYAMTVMDYSKGKTPCMSADSCGKYLPEVYAKVVVRLKESK